MTSTTLRLALSIAVPLAFASVQGLLAAEHKHSLKPVQAVSNHKHSVIGQIEAGDASLYGRDSKSWKKHYLAQRSESGGTGEASWQLIKTPMELPDIPKYSGQAVFVNGLMYPNKKGGASITLRYRAKETPDMVMSWYHDAMKNYQWKINPQKSDTMLSATHGGNGVTVNVYPAKAKGFKTEFKIGYKLSNK